jgi:hypothetical protein
MANLLWREGWLKPLVTESLPSEKCNQCKKEFEDHSFVTSCEFCDIGVMHNKCADNHIVEQHMAELSEKISKHKEKSLHSFQ